MDSMKVVVMNLKDSDLNVLSFKFIAISIVKQNLRVLQWPSQSPYLHLVKVSETDGYRCSPFKVKSQIQGCSCNFYKAFATLLKLFL